ncbi:hypothetical protein GCM10009818_19860 [Nakamurella flavida]
MVTRPVQAMPGAAVLDVLDVLPFDVLPVAVLPGAVPGVTGATEVSRPRVGSGPGWWPATG